MILPILTLLVFLSAARMAATQPVLDPGAVPGLGVPGRAAYANYLLSNLPRAFATDGKSNFGWHDGVGTAETAREKAIAACAKPGCEVWSEDLDVVWGGHNTKILKV